MNSSVPIYKIVVLGEGRVGKTSMTLKYTKNEFHDDQ
jgi:GTPase SAR1 family protein